jgi:hypothetical protein
MGEEHLVPTVGSRIRLITAGKSSDLAMARPRPGTTIPAIDTTEKRGAPAMTMASIKLMPLNVDPALLAEITKTQQLNNRWPQGLLGPQPSPAAVGKPEGER